MTNTKRDFAKDRAICDAVTPLPEGSGGWFVMHDKDVVFENPPGSCELEDVVWSLDTSVAQFIAEARTGWPAALDRIAELERDAAYWQAEAKAMNLRAAELEGELDGYIEENERLLSVLRRLDDRTAGMMPRSQMARIVREAIDDGR